MPISRKQTTISSILSLNELKKLSEYSTEARVLVELIVLINDIKYRRKYLKSFDYVDISHYSQVMDKKSIQK